jgi:hypothetical protein
VIRVDPPGGDIDANLMPVNPEGLSLCWASLNHGKRSGEIGWARLLERVFDIDCGAARGAAAGR